MTLVAYFDDSREDQKAGSWHFHSIAGYVAPSDTWDSIFVPRWLKLIKSAPHPIAEFKASDCRHGTGEFRRWSASERSEFGIRAVTELASAELHQLFGVGAAIRIPKNADQSERDSIFQTSLFEVMSSVTLYANHLGGVDQIQFICDKQPGLQRRLHDAWTAMRPLAERMFDVRLSDLRFEDSVDVKPIQAADILAYETRKDMKSRFERPLRPMSRALVELLKAQSHLAYYYDRTVMHEVLQYLRSGRLREWPGAPVLYASKLDGILPEGVRRRLMFDPRSMRIVLR